MNPIGFGPIPFEVPAKWAAHVARGEVILRGTNLVWQNTGRIAGHLQEAGGMAAMLGSGNPVTAVVSLGSSLLKNVQLHQMKVMLGTITVLSGATLAASLAGIGVSVAGFAIIANRLSTIKQTIDTVDRRVKNVEKLALRQEAREAMKELAETAALMEQADQAWHRRDPRTAWEAIDQPLLGREREWRLKTEEWFLHPSFSLEEAVAAHQTNMQLAAAYLQNLMLQEEIAAAIHFAKGHAEWHDRLMQRLTPTRMAEAHARMTALAQSIREDDAYQVELRTSSKFLDSAVRTQLLLEQRGDLLQTVQRRSLSGVAFVKQLRENTSDALAVLPA